MTTSLIKPVAKFSACLVAGTIVLATPSLLIVLCFWIAFWCIYRLFQLPLGGRHVKPPTPVNLAAYLTKEDRDWLRARGWRNTSE